MERNRRSDRPKGGWSLLAWIEIDGIGEERSSPRVREIYCESQEELARGLSFLLGGMVGSLEDGWRDLGRGIWEKRWSPWRIRVAAVSPKGNALRPGDLLKSRRRAERKLSAERDRERWGRGWNGAGPVPGTGRSALLGNRWRAGIQKDRGFGSLRADSRRISEELEPAARASRAGKETKNRFSLWEDPFWRKPQKSWKENRKGFRQWDRGA